jgi:hypothetical protein
MRETKSAPEAYGVFKPVGHVVISYPNAQALEDAAAALTAQGFAADRLVRYSPEQMKAQAEADMRNASPLASLGQELNLVKAQRELAEQGYAFLVVPAADDAEVERVAAVARRTRAYTAQHYGRFVIEELIDRTPGRTQAFESPDRGLDVAVPDRERDHKRDHETDREPRRESQR